VDDEEEQDARATNDMELRDDQGSRVKIYKLNPQRPVRPPRMHLGEDEPRVRRGEATAQARVRGSAILPVRDPSPSGARQAGDIEVVATDKRQVSVTLTEAAARHRAVRVRRPRRTFVQGRRTLRRGSCAWSFRGAARLTLPRCPAT